VYDWNCKQIEVYEESALPIVESTLEGYNGALSLADAEACSTSRCAQWTWCDIVGVDPRAPAYTYRQLGRVAVVEWRAFVTAGRGRARHRHNLRVRTDGYRENVDGA
jgi:hypothetical protein